MGINKSVLQAQSERENGDTKNLKSLKSPESWGDQNRPVLLYVSEDLKVNFSDVFS